jgi:hypothetical protein
MPNWHTQNEDCIVVCVALNWIRLRLGKQRAAFCGTSSPSMARHSFLRAVHRLANANCVSICAVYSPSRDTAPSYIHTAVSAPGTDVPPSLSPSPSDVRSCHSRSYQAASSCAAFGACSAHRDVPLDCTRFAWLLDVLVARIGKCNLLVTVQRRIHLATAKSL